MVVKLKDHKKKLYLPLSILIAAQTFGFAPASHAATAEVNLLTNGSFEAPAYPGSWNIVDESDPTVAWKTSATDNKMEIWSHSNEGVSAYEGYQHAELNAYQESTLYQDVKTTPGQVLVWHLAHRGNTGTDVMKLQVGAPGNFTQPTGETTLSAPEISGANITYTKTTGSGTSTLTSPYSNSFTMSDENTEWGYYTGYYVVPEGQATTRFAFTAVSSAGGGANVGNFLDDVFFGTAGAPPVATDVNITGTTEAGQTLTGSYTYSDEDGDVESVTGSVYQWYSGSKSDGSDKTPIVGATDLTYAITDAEIGKYLFFEVTPKAQTGMPSGVPVVSPGLAIVDKQALGGLEVTGADGNPVVLSPAFDENVLNYTATTATYSVYLTPTLDSIAGLDPNAKIEISLNDGEWFDAKSGAATDDLPLNEGKNTIQVKVTVNGRETLYTLTIFRGTTVIDDNDDDDDDDDNNSNTGGGGGTTSPAPVTPEAPKADLDVTLNGNENPFATGTTLTSNGRTVTSAKVDQDKLTDAVSQGTGQDLVIHSPNEGDMTVEGLTADTLKKLSDKGASLEISNLLAIYPIPVGKINLSAVADQLGNAELGDIAVRIDIKRAAEDVIASAKSKAAAEGYELLVDPVDLDMTFSNGGQTVRAGQLNGYAVKYIALPEGVDPNRITTGVVVNPDGSVYHLPTVVTKINDRYFAQINDLRSSGIYSVIWNPQDFADVRTHWGKEDVNNISARLDLKGNGNNTFAPNRSVTRSEFSEIAVLGLGLMRQESLQMNFPDVPASAWYKNAVAIADEFDIVRGYNDGNFYGDKQITREESFAIIARAYRLIQSEKAAGQDTSVLSQYKDGAKVSNWAKADVAQLIQAGIIEGNGAVLNPQGTVTRAEVTALIARLLKTTNFIDK
ncbi:S-layer homology domain-containing protein [Paenibacillus sp. P96]|uniref:S-layer homology domain-containing protein n=1 Tax=Paenibacillus zeirhizosphaerae TaxID=2987519 RepID=A0ABT9FXI4_9BACL|nr:S-layer homology domain-containing protein [Paenibacillus sp. P96]MDP4099451.1 S-layer homology domain-containing protein [Paenibacillus sp. P96]